MFSAASGFTNGFGTTGQDSLLSKPPGKFSAFWLLSTLLQKVSGYSHHRLSQGTLVLFVSFFFFSSMPQGMRDTSSPTRVQTYTPCSGSGKCGLPTTGLPEKTPFGSVFTPFNLPNQWLKHLLLVTFLTAISVFGLLDFFKLNRAGSRPFTLQGSGRGPFSLPSLG